MKLFFAVPIPANKLWHIFKEDHRSLCGKFALIFAGDETITEFTGNEKYKKGQDCKACFRKAELLKAVK